MDQKSITITITITVTVVVLPGIALLVWFGRKRWCVKQVIPRDEELITESETATEGKVNKTTQQFGKKIGKEVLKEIIDNEAITDCIEAE